MVAHHPGWGYPGFPLILAFPAKRTSFIARLFGVGIGIGIAIGIGIQFASRNRSTLDSKRFKHHDAHMRTTVTLEKDVERMLRENMHRSQRSFKETLNTALRTGLTGAPVRIKSKRFVVKAKPMGLRAGIDPAQLNKLADALEVDAFLEETGARSRRADRT